MLLDKSIDKFIEEQSPKTLFLKHEKMLVCWPSFWERKMKQEKSRKYQEKS